MYLIDIFFSSLLLFLFSLPFYWSGGEIILIRAKCWAWSSNSR